MRNLKRFLAMTLTMLMVIGSFSFASFAQEFDDVYDYAQAIDVLSDLGVIWGYEDGTFGPDNTVERWHMSLWIAKMETGKTSTDDYLAIWRAEDNYTDFTDVEVDQAIGAINYAADEDIIIGTTPTTFAPTAGITYQDALTMVVRALGFGGKAMDAGYPWKYINKAAELGLEEGLSGIAYRDVLTRAQTAQILYNALYTIDANGKSYISDVFGLTTVVITGTPAYKIIETESVIRTGYVSFNVLNADGTTNGDVTYHLPAEAFGIEAADADDYIGASFKVTTDDNFKSLGTVIANPSATFDQSEIVGAGTPAAPTGKTLKLGEDNYEAVKKYSSLYNTQGIKGNDAEIIVYTTNNTQSTNDGYFKVDANYNVLDKEGKIVAYYAPGITGSYISPYAKRLGNDAYTVFLNNAEIIAAGGVWYGVTLSEYAQTLNTYDLVNKNKHATAVAYDDNADGVYDRLFYTYHEFCSISYDANTLKYNVNGGQVAVSKFIDGETGKALAAAPTGYIRYSYNPLSKYLTVYETYTFGTGLITTVNTATQKVVIGGTLYSVGYDTYPGAGYGNTGVNIGLVGKQVNFILDDGVVVRVFDAAVATKYVVFDNITGLTSAGYATALAYVESNAVSVITIATINGYSYQNYQLLAERGSLGNIIDPLATGDLFTGTKDALGFWHLETLAYKKAGVQDAITFKNGIGTGAGLNPFDTNGDSLYIVYDGNRFYTAKGIPANGSKINVAGNLFAWNFADTTTARFIYANTGSFENFVIRSTSPIFQYDTIIYVDASAAATAVTNDLGSTGTLLGSMWTYGNVLDMVNGRLITVHTAYNFRLKSGSFYLVSNGYVESEVAENNDEGINLGALLEYTKYTSDIYYGGAYDNEDSAATYIFNLINGNVEKDVNGALVNRALVEPVAVPTIAVYYYDGPQEHSRVMLYDSTKTPVLPAADFTTASPIPNAKVVMYDVDLNHNQVINSGSSTAKVDTLRFYFTGLQKYVPANAGTKNDPFACREGCWSGYDNEQIPATDGVKAGHKITIWAIPDDCHEVKAHSGNCGGAPVGGGEFSYDKVLLAEGIFYADEAGELVIDALEYKSENANAWSTDHFILGEKNENLTFVCSDCNATVTLNYFEGEYDFAVVIEALDNADKPMAFGLNNAKTQTILRPDWQPPVVLSAEYYNDEATAALFTASLLSGNTNAAVVVNDPLFRLPSESPYVTIPGDSEILGIEFDFGIDEIRLGAKPFIKYRNYAAGETEYESRFWGEGIRYNLLSVLDIDVFDQFIITYAPGTIQIGEDDTPLPIFDRSGPELRKNLKINFTADYYYSAERELDFTNLNYTYVLPFEVAVEDQTGGY